MGFQELHLIKTPAPKTPSEIFLYAHIERLQQERVYIYQCGQDNLAKRLEIEIVNLLKFMKDFQQS